MLDTIKKKQICYLNYDNNMKEPLNSFEKNNTNCPVFVIYLSVAVKWPKIKTTFHLKTTSLIIYRWRAWNLRNMARGDNKLDILDNFGILTPMYSILSDYVTYIFGFHTLQKEQKIH